jgi:hypothetical protein
LEKGTFARRSRRDWEEPGAVTWAYRLCSRFQPTATIEKPGGGPCPQSCWQISSYHSGTPMLLFARSQGHARRQSLRYHRRLACVLDSSQGRRSKGLEADLARRAVGRFPAVIPGHRRDAYDTFRSVSRARTSPSLRYHRRLACVPDSGQRRRSKAWRRTLLPELANFQLSFGDTGGTPMLLFARSQGTHVGGRRSKA